MSTFSVDKGAVKAGTAGEQMNQNLAPLPEEATGSHLHMGSPLAGRPLAERLSVGVPPGKQVDHLTVASSRRRFGLFV